MSILYRIVTFLLLVVLFSACGSGDNQNQQDDVATNNEQVEEAPVEVFDAAGKVISVPPSKRNVIIAHGDIPGFMGSMTMAFPVRDTTILSSISPQDSVHFEIESQGSAAYIISITTVE